MTIGIAAPIDISTFSGYLPEKEKELADRFAIKSDSTAVRTLILGFLKSGHKVRIYTLASTDLLLKGDNLEIYTAKPFTQYPLNFLWGDFANASRVRKLMASNIKDLDLLHAHWTYSYAYASSYFSLTIPVFCTVRDWTPYIWKIESPKNKITWSFRYIMNELVLRNSKINFISNSPYTSTLIKQKFEKITPVIPNAIASSYLAQKERIPPKDLILFCISSSNDKRKNVVSLLRAFQIVLKIVPNAKLMIAGSPFTAENAKVLGWEEDGLMNQVQMLGRLDHVTLKDYFDQSRIFITPSVEETFGNTVLESLARKVPVIAGREAGAIPYVLKGGRAGLLCDVTNPESIAKAILEAHRNYNEAESRAEFGFQLLTEEYLDTVVVSKHITLYLERLRYYKKIKSV
jgi:glycosyltransferase involved in cell wall biosynthesis